MTPAEIRAMNDRIAARRNASAQAGNPLPIASPKWADAVFDLGDELAARHAETAEPYPLDVQADLRLEDHCTVVIRRVISIGGTGDEIVRLIRAFGLDATARERLLRTIRGAS